MDIKTFFKKVVSTVEELTSTPSTPSQTSSSPSGTPSSTRQTYQPQPSYQEPQHDRSETEWMAYFKEILAQEFSQYSVRENVPVQDLAGDVSAEFQFYATRPQQAYKAEWGLPYTFVLFQPDGVKGVILLAQYQKQYKHVKFMVSRMYAKKMGVPFVSFYMDAPNERGYVVERIKSHVR